MGDFDDEHTNPPKLIGEITDAVDAFYEQAKNSIRLTRVASEAKDHAIASERHAWESERQSFREEIQMHEQANKLLREKLKEKSNGKP